MLHQRYRANALLLSFKQNFLDWLLDRQPKVRAFFSQVAPLRSKSSVAYWPAFPASRALLPSACSAHPPSPGLPREPVGSRNPSEQRSSYEVQKQETTCVWRHHQHSITGSAPFIFWLPYHRMGSLLAPSGKGPFCWQS